ncbi:MAG: hypothetical protein AAFV54_05230 [Pseudomonadota bacterium]
MMRILVSLFFMTLAMGALPAQAQLEPYEDFSISEPVWEVATVKVKSNATEHYLEGLKATWVRGQEAAKKLGHIEDYAIYSSITPESGDFNLMLVTKYASLAELGPSKEKYDAFIEELGRDVADAGSQRALETYPELREITGSYILHEITMN